MEAPGKRKIARSDHRPGFVLGMIVLTIVSLFLAIFPGAFPIPFHEVVSILSEGNADSPGATIIWDIRLSRICLSWIIGAGLGASGVVFQGLLRNPLADPFTLGVSSGGAFGASLAITLGLAGVTGLFGVVALPVAAFFGALVALVAVIALGSIGGRLRRETLVLAGIVISTFLSACISLSKALNEESVSAIVFWIMGSLQGRGWEHVLLVLPYSLVGLVVMFLHSRELDILSLGERQARQLGVSTTRVRVILLGGAGLVTAAGVAVAGIIGFVGLVVPHMVRLVIGAEHGPLLLHSTLLGGLLLVWSDVAARVILSGGAELPVGVITALLGGPFFCFLLRKQRGDSR
ncbi:iron complex transport system permease protein [Paucidesulfovibrio gracilis DSM 16080]|uniref:Iron complex transport system permease protein n=2 Tax=Paucidesulfovibrio TaxID=2910985 RepID=A0A1T4WNW2_9BACT|nr:iron complex transport system permease protein [Paucidesulfovibrio gracilis DSM 16080]